MKFVLMAIFIIISMNTFACEKCDIFQDRVYSLYMHSLRKMNIQENVNEFHPVWKSDIYYHSCKAEAYLNVLDIFNEL